MISITGGVTYVSDCDYDRVICHAWRVDCHNASGKPYVKRTDRDDSGRKCSVYLHRFIAGGPAGHPVDHRNGDGLLNTRENLRVASYGQNAANRAGSSLSGYKGVTQIRARFRARITIDGEETHIGQFGTAEEAARAYDKAAYGLFGEFAWLNFRDEWPRTDIPFFD